MMVHLYEVQRLDICLRSLSPDFWSPLIKCLDKKMCKIKFTDIVALTEYWEINMVWLDVCLKGFRTSSLISSSAYT